MPPPGYNLAESFKFSPDDNFITYLRSPNQSLTRQLFAYNLQTKNESPYLGVDRKEGVSEENLSMEEKLRREVSETIHP